MNMLKKYCVLALILLVFGTANAQKVFAVSPWNNQTSSVEKIKRAVTKAGVGEKARVTVMMRDGTKLFGYISEARENDFILTDKKTNNPVTILYADTAKVKENKLSLAAKIGIGVGVAVAAYVVFIAIITKGGTKRILD